MSVHTLLKLSTVSVKRILLSSQTSVFKGVFIATQLNSTRRRVELHRYRHFADATQLNSTSSRVELCRYRRVSIATQLNSTDPVEQRTAKSVVFLFMASRPTNWVNWVTTFIDRWQLFTLWTCRQLDVELSCVAINTPLVRQPWQSSVSISDIFPQTRVPLSCYYRKYR